MLKAQRKKKTGDIYSGLSVDHHRDNSGRGGSGQSSDDCQHEILKGAVPPKKGTKQSGLETKRGKKNRIALEHTNEDFDAILAAFMASNIDDSAVTTEDNPSLNLDHFQVEYPHATHMFLQDLAERINVRVKGAQAQTHEWLRRKGQFESMGGACDNVHNSIISDKRKSTEVEYLYQVAAKTLATQGDFRIIPTVLEFITDNLSKYPVEMLLEAPSKLAEKYKLKYKREIEDANDAMVQDKIRLFARFDKELDELRKTDALKGLVEWMSDNDNIFMHRLAFYFQNRSAERLAYLVADDRYGQEAKFKIIQLIEEKVDKFYRLVSEYQQVMTSSNELVTQQMEGQRRGDEHALLSMRDTYFSSDAFQSLLIEVRDMMALSTFFSELRESVVLSRTADDRMSFEILINNYEVTQFFESNGALNTMLITLFGTGLQEGALRTYLSKPEGINESDLLHFRKASKEYFSRMMVKSIEYSANIGDRSEIFSLNSAAIKLINYYAKVIKSASIHGLDTKEDAALLNDIYIKLKDNKKTLEQEYGVIAMSLDGVKKDDTLTIEQGNKLCAKYSDALNSVRYIVNDPIVNNVRMAYEQDIGTLLDSFTHFVRYVTPYITADNEGRFLVSYFYTTTDSQIESGVNKLIECDSDDVGFNVNRVLSELEAFNSELGKLKLDYSKSGVVLSEVIGRIDHYIKLLQGNFYEGGTSEVIDGAFYPESKKLEKGKAKRGRKYKLLSRDNEGFNNIQSSVLPMRSGEGAKPGVVDDDNSKIAKNWQSGVHKAKSISENVRRFFFNELSTYQTFFYEKPDVKLNAGNRWATYEAALELGRDWVGNNYRKNATGYISADGLRRFRSPKQKSDSTMGASGIQANFEERLSVNHKVFNLNYHLNIISDLRLAKMNKVGFIVA